MHLIETKADQTKQIDGQLIAAFKSLAATNLWNMERNSLMKGRISPSNYTIKPDGYGNLIIYMPDKSDQICKKSDCPNLSIPSDNGTKLLMKSLFFSRFCTKSSDGTKKLSLNGSDLFSKMGRHFNDNDVPDLLIFLRDNPEVEELSLAHNEIHCVGFVNIINHITADLRVVKLNVQNNEIRSAGIEHLCELAEELQLKTLRLSGNKFGVESSKQLALRLLKNRYIRRLDVAEVDQTASSLVYFTTVLRTGNDTLKVLDISRPNPGCMHYFDTAHFSSILGSMLKNNNCLEELYLRKFGFSCHDIENMMTEGRFNKTLLLIDLGGNNIGDFGTEIIANWLKERPALSTLMLDHNIVTSTGASALSYGLPTSKIRHLDVSHNRMSDSGISEILNTLKKSPCIKSLRVFGNCLGHDTAKIVYRMLLSGVLVQDYLDVKPYRVDHEWFCARYSADRYRDERN